MRAFFAAITSILACSSPIFFMIERTSPKESRKWSSGPLIDSFRALTLLSIPANTSKSCSAFA